MTTVYMCVLCDTEMSNGTHCIKCNEYKSAMEYTQWLQFNLDHPRKVVA
jgi:hypothetical protein